MAWFIVLHDLDIAIPHGVEGTQDPSEGVYGLALDCVTVSNWKVLLIEYGKVLEGPGKLVARAVDHGIDFMDSMEPPSYLWLYRILEDDFFAIKYTISDCIEKLWIRPNLKIYGA